MFKNPFINYAAFVIAVIIACGLTSSVVERLNNTVTVNNKSYNVILTAKDVTKSAIDMETGARGFFLNRNALFLQPYYTGQTDFKNNVQELKKVDGISQESKRHLEEAQRLQILWAQKSQVLIDKLSMQETKRNLPSFKEDKVLNNTIQNTALERKTLMDSFRSHMIAIESEETLRLKLSLDETNKYRTYIRIVFFAGPIVSISAIFLLTRMLETSTKDRNIALDRLSEERKNNLELTDNITKLTASLNTKSPKKAPVRKPRKKPTTEVITPDPPSTSIRKPRKPRNST